MKAGQKVWVCQDGRITRAAEGIVAEQHNGHHITVEFVDTASDDELLVRAKFRRIPRRHGRGRFYGGCYEGWAETESLVPFYVVLSEKRMRVALKPIRWK